MRTKTASFISSQQFPQLHRRTAALVARADRSADLHPLDLRLEVNGKLSDTSSTRFGIREVTSELTPSGTASSTSTARTF